MSNNKKNDTEGLQETVASVKRVVKVVKGGRKFSFSACVITGDKAGRVGHGRGKAKEVTEARLKATQDGKRNMIKIPLYQNRTIHHDVVGKSGAARVILRSAKPGTGIIAGGPMRAIFSALGVRDIVAKSLGSSNVYTMISATLDALLKLSSPRVVSDRRDKKIQEISTRPSRT